MQSSLTATLSVDLGALVANWRALDAMSPRHCETAAVVKGDGYGCGAGAVAGALCRAGARTFFVATPCEGEALRRAIGEAPVIYVLGGYGAAEHAVYHDHTLRPVLNTTEQARAWFNGLNGPSAVQIDTGMNRLGMEADELASLGTLPTSVELVMSHMGNADDPAHPMNGAQRKVFDDLTHAIGIPKSLGATAGLLLGEAYCYDMVRIGIGLYGGWPYEHANPVVRVDAPVIQVRDLEQGESVGYGATYVAARPTRIATISVGYADGVIRALGNGTASAYVRGHPVPLAGRVSMDLITLDVTGVACADGDMVELIGPHQGIDTVAAGAGTIGHEILTSLGSRYRRIYCDAAGV